MKKLLKTLLYCILGIVVLVLIVIAVALSPFGNKIIASYAQDIITQKIGYEFKFDKFRVGFSALDVQSKINNEISANLIGNYSLFSQKFDINYSINAKEFEQNKIDLDINGYTKGELKDFAIEGGGKLVGSNAKFSIVLKDFIPAQIKIDSKQINLNDLSMIAMKKPYLDGKLNIIADMNSTNNELFGTAKIYTNKIIPNFENIKNDFNIALPAKADILINSDINAQNNKIFANTNLTSSLFTAVAKKTSYDLNNSDLNSDFSLDINDLSKFVSLTGQKLSGSLKVNGDIAMKNNTLDVLNASLIGLGGSISSKLSNNQLDAKINNIKLDQILSFVQIKPLLKGGIDGVANISNLNNMDKIAGFANLEFKNAKFDSKILNENFGGSSSADIPFNLKANLALNDSKASVDSQIGADFIKTGKINANYDLKAQSGLADVRLDITSLKKLFGNQIKSGIKLDATAKIENNALYNANATLNGLGGSAKVDMSSDKLNLNASNLSLGEILLIAGMTELANANLNANLALNDLTNLNGNGEISIKNGVFNKTAMSKMLEKDFPANTKFEAVFKPVFKNSIVDFTTNIKSDLANLSKFDGSFDTKKTILNAKFNASIDNLNKLSFLTNGMNLRGNLVANGDIGFDKTLSANINSQVFDGTAVAKLANDKVQANLKDIKIEKLLYTLGYDEFYLANANVNANYDLKASKGDFKADLKDGKIAQSGFTNLLKTVLGRDLTQEAYKTGSADGKINKQVISFNAATKSDRTDISIKNGVINDDKLSIPVKANIEKTDIEIKITGTTEKPSYSVSSQYLQNKIKDKILDTIYKGDDKQDKKNEANELIKGLGNILGGKK